MRSYRVQRRRLLEVPELPGERTGAVLAREVALLQDLREKIFLEEGWYWSPRYTQLPRKSKKALKLEGRALKLLLKDIQNREHVLASNPDVPEEFLLRCLRNGWGWDNPSTPLYLLTHLPGALRRRDALAQGLIHYVCRSRGYCPVQFYRGMRRDPERWLPRLWPYEATMRTLWPWPPPT